MSTEIEDKITTLDIGKKMITIRSSDGETFVIEEAVALKSETIRHMIEDGCADNVIPLANINSKNLTKVIEYCSKQVHEERKNDWGKGKASLEEWDAEYIAVDENELYHLIMAANYLNVQGLVDLACQSVADRIKGKQPDMPPELEEKIRMENQWGFEV